MAIDDKRLTALLPAIFLGVLSAQFSFGQLYSRPASVMLIATLEQLSVSATPAIPAVSQAGAKSAGSHPIAITTSWAVPAHRTTMRLFGGFSDTLPAESKGAPAADSGAAASGAETLRPGDAGLTLMTQGAGETSRADSRTNLINLEFGRKPSSEPGHSAGMATFNIRMEAF